MTQKSRYRGWWAMLSLGLLPGLDLSWKFSASLPSPITDRGLGRDVLTVCVDGAGAMGYGPVAVGAFTER